MLNTLTKIIDTTAFTYIYDYSANSLVSLERKECAKHLGVLIDSKLSWTHHITYISTKISKSLGILARLRHFAPSSTLLNIYRSLVQPYLSFWYSRKWSSFSYKFGENFDSSKTCPWIDSFPTL